VDRRTRSVSEDPIPSVIGWKPPSLGVVEDRLVRVALGADAYRRPEHVLDWRVGHAPRDPARGDLVERALPDLLVVGIHEVVGNAVTEAPAHPGCEVRGRVARVHLARVPGLHVAREAVEILLCRQVADPVLERVVHPAVAEADLGVPVAAYEGLVAASAVLHPLHGRSVLAEQDVTTGDVVGEALDRLGSAQSSDHGAGLEEGQRVLVDVAFDEETGER
jgi:hypothetical protein